MKESEHTLSEVVWNRAELLGRVDNDPELLRELLGLFKEDFPRTIRSLEAAVAGGDLKNSASLSHTLKGMLSNLGAGRASTAAARLEAIATSGEEAGLKNALSALQGETTCLLSELDTYMTEVWG